MFYLLFLVALVLWFGGHNPYIFIGGSVAAAVLFAMIAADAIYMEVTSYAWSNKRSN